MSKLSEVFFLLVEDEDLPNRYKDHLLSGNWKGHRDLHLEPDWLLIYKLTPDTVTMVRTGTHADIF